MTAGLGDYALCNVQPEAGTSNAACFESNHPQRCMNYMYEYNSNINSVVIHASHWLSVLPASQEVSLLVRIKHLPAKHGLTNSNGCRLQWHAAGSCTPLHTMFNMVTN
jgi:hypothetical protein